MYKKFECHFRKCSNDIWQDNTFCVFGTNTTATLIEELSLWTSNKSSIIAALGILFSRSLTTTCHSTAPVLHWPFEALRMKSLATHDQPWLTSQPRRSHTFDSALSYHAHLRQMSGVPVFGCDQQASGCSVIRCLQKLENVYAGQNSWVSTWRFLGLSNDGCKMFIRQRMFIRFIPFKAEDLLRRRQ